jgi:hypothetical protein
MTCVYTRVIKLHDYRIPYVSYFFYYLLNTMNCSSPPFLRKKLLLLQKIHCNKALQYNTDIFLLYATLNPTFFCCQAKESLMHLQKKITLFITAKN